MQNRYIKVIDRGTTLIGSKYGRRALCGRRGDDKQNFESWKCVVGLREEKSGVATEVDGE